MVRTGNMRGRAGWEDRDKKFSLDALSWSNKGDIQVEMSDAYGDDGPETGGRSGLVSQWPLKSRL